MRAGRGGRERALVLRSRAERRTEIGVVRRAGGPDSDSIFPTLTTLFLPILHPARSMSKSRSRALASGPTCGRHDGRVQAQNCRCGGATAPGCGAGAANFSAFVLFVRGCGSRASSANPAPWRVRVRPPVLGGASPSAAAVLGAAPSWPPELPRRAPFERRGWWACGWS